MKGTSGMKVYLVIEVGHPDAGWPVSIFSTQEKALKECKRLAERQVKSFIRMDKRLKMDVGNYLVEHYHEGRTGFSAFRVEKNGKKYGWRGFEIEEHLMDKPNRKWVC